jgi:hypothetical protein
MSLATCPQSVIADAHGKCDRSQITDLEVVLLVELRCSFEAMSISTRPVAAQLVYARDYFNQIDKVLSQRHATDSIV